MPADARTLTEGRVPLARHAVHRDRHPLVAFFAVFAVALAVVGVSGASITAFSVWDAANSLSANAVVLGEDEVIPPSLGAIEGGVNLLMVGTDCLEDGSRPRAKAGDSVEITATGFVPLVNHFVQEAV